MTRGQGTQEEPDEFPYLNVEFLYLIKRAATPSFHSNLPRNKEREEHILRLLLLKTTTCPSRTLLDPTCRYYFAYYSSSDDASVDGDRRGSGGMLVAQQAVRWEKGGFY